MFTVVVYHKPTNKVIAMLPLVLHDPTRISLSDVLLHNDYGFGIFPDTRPILGEDSDGDICVRPNGFIINSDQLL